VDCRGCTQDTVFTVFTTDSDCIFSGPACCPGRRTIVLEASRPLARLQLPIYAVLSHVRFRAVFWLASGAAWLGLGASSLFGHDLVLAMYEGRSFGPLNAVIEGQSVHPVEFYYRAFDHSIREAAMVLVVIAVLGLLAELMRALKQRTIHPWSGAIGILATASLLPVGGALTGSAMLKQLGLLVAILSIALVTELIVKRDRPDEVVGAWQQRMTGVAIFISVLFAAGELILRAYFFSGETFANHGGPIVRRFERDFVFNRYDGPSRGPEIVGSRENPREVRILVQGDSVTWGQGVSRESDLYSQRMRSALRLVNRNVEVAVLAQPGREIDGHLRQLREWGEQIDPDVIILQWYFNDMELSKRGRPVAKGRVWREFFLHRQLALNSYLWFFLDFGLDRVLPAPPRTYYDYIEKEYAVGTHRWSSAIDVFDAWVAEARRYTPNVIVALYPVFDRQGRQHAKDAYIVFEAYCRNQGLVTVDLWDSLRPIAADSELVRASPYDGHPSAAAHERIAKALIDKLTAMGVITLADEQR
jgi:lysophospholipase L1-like esterase